MPSAEETSYLIEVMPDSGQDNFTSHDVDVLVSRIKQNLRLSGLKTKRLAKRKTRPTSQRPKYDWSNVYNENTCIQREKQQILRGTKKNWKFRESHTDSYERFKMLLRRGLLIKEAVKRLQTCDEEDEDDDEESCSTRRASTTSATSATLDDLDSMDV